MTISMLTPSTVWPASLLRTWYLSPRLPKSQHLKLTLQQEKEAEDLMTEAFSKNFIDYEEYPRSAEIQNRCVSMIARMFNARKSAIITNAQTCSAPPAP